MSELSSVWVGSNLFVRGTITQLGYVFQEVDGKWHGIAYGLEGKGTVNDLPSKEEAQKAVIGKLLKAAKCTQYRSTISGELLKTREAEDGE